MSDPDLSDLEAFVAVATTRSFRGAAKLRNQSPSALSEALRRLENHLDIRLLNRTTRSVTPTEAGQRLLERLSPALGEVSNAVQSMRKKGDGIGGTLRLNVPSVAADLILPDLLSRFLIAHPGVTAEVTADNNFIDVLAAGFDAGIRFTERLERDMIAIPIGPRIQRFVTVASPEYLERNGTPRHPNDLLDHACIRFRFSSGVIPPWEFARDGQQLKVSPRGPLVSNRIEVLRHAAIAGVGILHSFEGFVAAALEQGQVHCVLLDWAEEFPGPFLYYASRRHMPGALRAFIDFIKADAHA
jgi:DNA-binding transcriptional LysR family regulator